MARSLSVKIPTATLIADIEATIAKIEEDIANYPALVEAHRAESKAYEANIIALAIEALKTKTDLIGTNHDSPIRVATGYRDGSVQVTLDGSALGFPNKPEAPNNPNARESFGREYTTRLELLKKNLKVLKMTNQEEVNASTYNTVMELL